MIAERTNSSPMEETLDASIGGAVWAAVPAFSDFDFLFELRDWWPQPDSASGRWYEYVLYGPHGKTVGVGDTALAAITDAESEYRRRYLTA